MISAPEIRSKDKFHTKKNKDILCNPLIQMFF